jgi:DNA-binding Lrp family transcriptional regulator
MGWLCPQRKLWAGLPGWPCLSKEGSTASSGHPAPQQPSKQAHLPTRQTEAHTSAIRTVDLSAMTNTPLDKTDIALLALLRDDARMPTAELARRLKLSRTTVQSRMERLQRQRVIAGYTVVVPEALEAELVRAHVLITLAPKRSGAIEVALRKIPEVRVLHSVSGPFDLIAVVAAASIGELDALIDRIGSLDGVERTTSAIVLSTRIQR